MKLLDEVVGVRVLRVERSGVVGEEPVAVTHATASLLVERIADLLRELPSGGRDVVRMRRGILELEGGADLGPKTAIGVDPDSVLLDLRRVDRANVVGGELLETGRERRDLRFDRDPDLFLLHATLARFSARST